MITAPCTTAATPANQRIREATMRESDEGRRGLGNGAVFAQEIADPAYRLQRDVEVETGKAAAQARDGEFDGVGRNLVAEFGQRRFDLLLWHDAPRVAQQQFEHRTLARRDAD